MAATEVQKKELLDKVAKLIKHKFAGGYHKAFDHYAHDIKDGKISKPELVKLLGDAGVGNWMTRGQWADGIIAELDKDRDGGISWTEFEEVLKG
jgi:Ca2+-binding EF-hand superfamily protein